MPKVSIITPCYNSARYIGETVYSILSQTLTDWEMIVVDDGSQDDLTAAMAGHLEVEPRLRLIHKVNGGVASARNRGFRESCPESRYLLFLDADDFLEPTALEELAQYMDKHPEVGMAYCDPTLIGEDSRELHDEQGKALWKTERLIPTQFWLRTVPLETPETTLASLFALTTIIPSMSLIRRSTYGQIPGFDETFGHLYEDMDVFLQLALRSEIHHYPKELLRYRQHAAQSTANKHKLWQQEQKLFVKWRQSASNSLNKEEAQRVQAALQFREGRVVPQSGFETAKALFRRGQIAAGVRFFAGALRRYRPFLASDPLKPRAFNIEYDQFSIRPNTTNQREE